MKKPTQPRIALIEQRVRTLCALTDRSGEMADEIVQLEARADLLRRRRAVVVIARATARAELEDAMIEHASEDASGRLVYERGDYRVTLARKAKMVTVKRQARR